MSTALKRRKPRLPQLNPVTVKMAKDFKKSARETLELLWGIGWEGDKKKFLMRMMDLTEKQIIQVQKYAATVHARATHGGKVPHCPQYIKKVLGGWQP